MKREEKETGLPVLSFYPPNWEILLENKITKSSKELKKMKIIGK